MGIIFLSFLRGYLPPVVRCYYRCHNTNISWNRWHFGVLHSPFEVLARPEISF
jgi:hypothetical protein